MTTQGTRIRSESERSSTLRVRLTRAFQRAMRTRAEKAESSSLFIHAPMFLVPLSMLVMANAATSVDVLWSLIPASGGILSLLHYHLAVRAKKRDAREAAALPPLDEVSLRAVRSLIAARTGFRHHLAVTTAGAAMAAATILLFAATGPWLLPAIGAAGLALASHYILISTRQRQMRRLLREAGVEFGAARPVSMDTDAAVPDSVIELCDRILDELQDQGEPGTRLRSELEPEIDDYLHHLHRLAGLRAELDRAGAGTMDSWKIEAELRELRLKLRGDVSVDLQREHQEAIDQYEAHLRSMRSLEERRESIDLRMKSAVSALQQIAVDVSRLRATGVPVPLPSLRDRARELSTYVDDVQAGYRQLDGAAQRS